MFIASRSLCPHTLGLYAEALFLTSLITYKFVPPLNEVAFPAYARMQHDRPLLAASFLKAVRLIMLVDLPALRRAGRGRAGRGGGGARREVDGDEPAGGDPRAGDAGDDAAHPVRARR